MSEKLLAPLTVFLVTGACQDRIVLAVSYLSVWILGH